MMTSMWLCRSIYGNFLVIVTSGSYQEEVKVERGERRHADSEIRGYFHREAFDWSVDIAWILFLCST